MVDQDAHAEATLLRSFSGWVVAAVLAGIPVALAVLQILWIAKGDQQVVRAVLVDLNITSLLASVFVDALRAGVFIVCVSIFPTLRRLDTRRKVDPNPTPGEWAWFIALATVTALLTNNALRAAGVIAASGTFLLFGSYLVRQANKQSNTARRRLGEYGTVCTLVVLTLGAMMLSVRASWLPVETVEVGNLSPARAYILSTNDNVVSLIYENGSLARVKVADVKSVTLCPERSVGPNGIIHRYWHPSLLRIFLQVESPSIPDGCSRE